MGASSQNYSMDVNGKLLTYYRAKRGWTQDELAQAAGVSDRTIRHAEAGRTIKRDVLEGIAESLSTTLDPLSWIDLSTDQLSLITRFRESYAFGERQLAHLVKDVVSEDFQYWGAGDEAIMDCAGYFDGLSKFDCFVQAFFDLYDRPFKDLYTKGKVYFHGKDFVVDTQDAGRIHGAKETIQLRLVLLGRIQNGKIVEMQSTMDGVALTDYVLANKHLEQSGDETSSEVTASPTPANLNAPPQR